MPFDPGQQNNLLPLLLNFSLQQRIREEERARNEELISRRRADDAFDKAVQLIPHVGYKAAVSLVGPELPTDRLEGLKGLEKAYKARQQEELARQESLAGAGAIGGLMAPTVDQRGNLVESPNAQQAAEALQRAMGLSPDLAPLIQNRADIARMAQERQVREGRAATQEQRGFALGQQAESRDFSRGKELLETTASRIGEEIAAGSYAGREPLISSLMESAGLSRTRATKLVSEAEYRGQALAKKIAREEIGAQGKRGDVILMEAQERAIRNRFPDFDDEQYIKDAAVLTLNNKAAHATFAEELLGRPVVVPVSGSTEANRVSQRQAALMEMWEQKDVLRDSFNAMRAAGVGGPLQTDSFFDALNLFGAQPAEVAAYRSSALLFASALLKATQGSRPSDFDFKNFLALVPKTTEVYSRSADAKLDQLENILRIQAAADTNDPAAREAIRQMKRNDNAYDKSIRTRLRSLGAQFEKAEEAGDQATMEKITGQVFKIANEWQTSGRGTVPPGVGGAPLAPADSDLLNKIGIE